MFSRFFPDSLRRALRLAVVWALLAASLQPMPALAAPQAEILTVTTPLDDPAANCQFPNLCSLRGAITRANNNPQPEITIQLGPGTYELTRPLRNEDANASGDLDLLASMTIVGVGAGSTVISAKVEGLSGIDRVLDIPNSGVNVTLISLTIQNGSALSTDTTHIGGAGIYNNGDLSLADVTVQKNYATADNNTTVNGGGIYNAGSLSLTRTTLLENEVRGVYKESEKMMMGGGMGGGLYNTGTATLNASLVKGNKADPGHGGGIYNFGDLTVTESTILNNMARGDNGSRSKNKEGLLLGGGFGGGIYNRNMMRIERSTLYGNSASGGSGLNVCASQGGGGGGAGLGGAVYNESVAPVTITTSTLSGNSANGGSGGNSHELNVYCTTGGHGGGAGGAGGDNFQENGGAGQLGGGGGGGATAMGFDYGTDGGPGGFGGGGGGGAPYWVTVPGPGNTVGDGGAGSTIASLSLLVSGAGAPGGGNMSDGAVGGSGGGGAGIGGAVFNRVGSMDIQYSTIINNHATGGSPGAVAAGAPPAGAGKGVAAGIYSSGELTTGNNIIFDNVSAEYADCAGSLTALASGGHNLFGLSTTCPYSLSKNDIRTGDAKIDAALKDNGGPTQTHALLAGSPAIDAAQDCTAGQVDQRGLPRPHKMDDTKPGSCDIGAYEARANQPPQVDLLPAYQTNEKDPLEFRGQNTIYISDSDAYSNDIKVRFEVTSGSLTLEEVSGLTEVSGNGTGTLTLIGPVEKIQAAVSHTAYGGTGPWKGLKFQAEPDSPPSFTFKAIANDLGNTGVGGGADLEFPAIITIDLVDDEPTGIELAPASVVENQVAVEIGTLTTLDPDSNPYTYTVVDPGSPFEISGTQLRLKLGQSLDFEAQPVVAVTVKSEGNTGQAIIRVLHVTVLNVNESPIAQDDLAVLRDKTLPVTIPVLDNDTDPDAGDSLEIKSFTDPQNGTVIQQGNNLVYTPGPGFQAFDSFSYTIRDQQGLEATAQVDIYPGLVFLPMIMRSR